MSAIAGHMPWLPKVRRAAKQRPCLAASWRPMTIHEAAAVIGVSAATLRRWDASGRFRPHRHPINGYRLYVREDVMRVRNSMRILLRARGAA